jgi:MerR family transcriptional regulator/heat shock protein HspR
MDENEPVYAIAVAARLSRMHPQTLRKYERAGLIRPARQSGNQRLYSPADVTRLRRIRYLVEERGLNVAGIEMTMSMVDRLDHIAPGASADEIRVIVANVLRLSEDRGSS